MVTRANTEIRRKYNVSPLHNAAVMSIEEVLINLLEKKALTYMQGMTRGVQLTLRNIQLYLPKTKAS